MECVESSSPIAGVVTRSLREHAASESWAWNSVQSRFNFELQLVISSALSMAFQGVDEVANEKILP